MIKHFRAIQFSEKTKQINGSVCAENKNGQRPQPGQPRPDQGRWGQNQQQGPVQQPHQQRPGQGGWGQQPVRQGQQQPGQQPGQGRDLFIYEE